MLARLREIELEVLARLEDKEGGEHVGSMRLVHHVGKRAMPIFDLDPKSREGAKECEVEEDVQKIEEDALMTLAGLDIGGGGASVVSEKGKTWRTARWHERGIVLSQYADASEMRGGSDQVTNSRNS